MVLFLAAVSPSFLALGILLYRMELYFFNHFINLIMNEEHDNLMRLLCSEDLNNVELGIEIAKGVNPELFDVIVDFLWCPSAMFRYFYPRALLNSLINYIKNHKVNGWHIKAHSDFGCEIN